MRAWDAYLDALQDDAYYFTVDELLAIITTANINVIVFTQVGPALTYRAGHFDGQGPPVACKLEMTDVVDGDMRSHFERLVSAPHNESHSLPQPSADIIMQMIEKRRREEDALLSQEVDDPCMDELVPPPPPPHHDQWSKGRRR